MRKTLSTTLATALTLSLAAAGAAAQDKPADAKPAANPVVIFSTNMGDITMEFWPEKAPVTVENFLAYVDAGFFAGTIFHRVIPGFVIQGGGMTKDMSRKPTRAPIKNEADNGLNNERGTLSMARTNDVNSASSQFFINLKANASLDHSPRSFGYAVFGKVIAGMDVVDKIAATPTSSAGMHQDVPKEPVVVISAKRK